MPSRVITTKNIHPHRVTGRVLSILEDLITMWGYQYVRLDGNTPVTERQVLIDRYNDEPDTLFIFLLSTRAGGVGINLTSADTVIFYDIAFNPQVDRQAEDRCHRLGQLKEVTIYKMITTETVDEHMLRMADRKAQLNDVMLEEVSLLFLLPWIGACLTFFGNDI